MRRITTYFIPSIGHFLFLSIFLVLALTPAGKQMLADADTGYHIRAGEYILEHAEVPKHDIFSFHSPPPPWTAHEWLAEVVMAVVHRTAGLTGVAVFFSLLVALSYALLFRFLRIYGRNIVFDVIIILVVLISSQIHWLARPHIFSLLLMVVWYRILDEHWNDLGNGLYLLPPVMLFWVNLHGGYLAGFILAGVYLLGALFRYARATEDEKAPTFRKVKSLGTVVAACLLVSLVNPYGYRILFFPFQLMSESYILDNVNEFLSPDFHGPMPFKYLILLTVAVLAVSKNPPGLVDIVLLMLFLNMALFAARYIPLFAVITAPVLSRHADSLLAEYPENRWASSLRRSGGRIASIDASARGYVWPAGAVLLVIGLAAVGRIEFRFDDKIKPVAAVEFLINEHIHGNPYNDDEFGDYLIYAAHSRYKVFFDGRSDMYGVERFKEYQKVSAFAPGWEKIAEKYDFGWFFIGSDSYLSRFLLQKKGWKLIYSDNVANIHVKNGREYRYLLDKYRDVKPVVRKGPDGGGK